MSPWNGEDRRSPDSSDHDLLLRINENVNHIKDWASSHKEEDNQKHEENLKKFDKIQDTQTWHSRVIYGCLGIVAFLQLFGVFHK